MTRNPHFYENAAHALVTDLSSRFGLALGLEFRLPLVEAGRLLDKRTAQVETFNRARGKWKKHAIQRARVNAELARARETIATLHAAYMEAEGDIRYADAVRRLIAGLDAVAPAWRYSRPDERTARVWDEFLCVVDGQRI